MITDSFDTETEPIVTLKAFYGERQYVCDVCIVTFSDVVYKAVLHSFACEKVSKISCCYGEEPIYTFEWQGKKIAFFKSDIGSTRAAANVIDLNWLVGATKFIMFGSAGSLDSFATAGKYVIPTEAYRDEGMSYHYAAPADYIKVSRADTVASIFDSISVPYVKGRVWTTDAMLRETRKLVQNRREEGCVAVEMELAGVQAVCDFHGFQLYDFLVTGDILDQIEYSIAGLSEANNSMKSFYLALEIAARL